MTAVPKGTTQKVQSLSPAGNFSWDICRAPYREMQRLQLPEVQLVPEKQKEALPSIRY